jgi:DNA-binding response OmpR family regulator
LTLLIGPLEEMIEQCPENDSQTKHRYTLMLRNAQRLMRLINQLLELSKLDSGKMKLQAVKTDIVSFIKGIVDSFHYLARQKELELFFRQPQEPCPEECAIYIDPRKMEDIMSNLLINALKMTPPGGIIAVDMNIKTSSIKRFVQGYIEINVRDTGPGIPSEQQEHIFDRFYQAKHHFETHEKGSGIGLSLSRELVELHHGTISVTSLPSEGSTFTICLPIGKEHLRIEEIAQPGAIENGAGVALDTFLEPVDKNGSPSMLVEEEPTQDIILVVEDSADMREYIRVSLESNYQVIEAVNGREGLEKAQTLIPDLIVCDVMMPEMDGYQLCKQLKSERLTSHIPVILLTAKASEENMIEGLEQGADDYVTKPFSMAILSARINNLIDLRRQLQQNLHRELTMKPVKTSISTLDREFLEELKGVVKKYVSDPNFNVEQLSKRLYMSGTTLYRKIVALYGQTPTEFLRAYRLKQAAQMLRNGSGSVTEVAFDVGFTSRAYFTKCFKEKFHTLPSNYGSNST